MKTNKLLFVLIPAFLIFYSTVSAQQIKINKNEEFFADEEQSEFYYLSQELDSTIGLKVADAELNIERDKGKLSLNSTFYALWKEANALGANSFYVKEVELDSAKNEYKLEIELVFLADDELDENLALYPKNLVVVMGDIQTKKLDKKKKFKIAGEKQSVLPYSYFRYQNAADKSVSVSVGGFTGTSVEFKGEEGRLPVFVSLGGGSVSPMVGGTVGLSFSTGSLFPMDMNFGLFLMDVFDMSKL